jgi:hypothetical protein
LYSVGILVAGEDDAALIHVVHVFRAVVTRRYPHWTTGLLEGLLNHPDLLDLALDSVVLVPFFPPVVRTVRAGRFATDNIIIIRSHGVPYSAAVDG